MLGIPRPGADSPIRIAFAAFIVLALAGGAFAQDSPPVIESITPGDAQIDLEIGDLTEGAAYSIQRRMDLVTGDWTNLTSFAGFVGSTNWTDTAIGGLASGYYRVARTPYHPKVGETAELITRFHEVTGTATITDNDTITITHFNYNGGGLDVRVVVSPNGTFSPYTVISDDLVRPGNPYVDDTLILDAPEDLDQVSYISIWCIDAAISFGDGEFVSE